MSLPLPDTTKQSAAKLSKSAQLRDLLTSAELSFLMEAHDGLSAKIVEEAGFKGVWASGLSMATALGVRDSNEASWTQVLEVLEFMSDATSIPILVDGDTGYGEILNVMRTVKELEHAGAAAVHIEDQILPKKCGHLNDKRLITPEDAAAKIAAAVKGRSHLRIIARTDAAAVEGLKIDYLPQGASSGFSPATDCPPSPWCRYRAPRPSSAPSSASAC